MNHLFRLGPVETDEGAGFIYVLATPRGLEPLRADEDADAVQEAVSRVGSALLCEPALARAAEPFSVRAAELPEPVAVERALMALVLSSQGMLTKIRDGGLLLELIDATAAFEDAEPWNVFEADAPFDVELKGVAPARLEGCVMGQAGEQLGLALYFSPGSVQTLSEMMDSGRPEDVTALDTMALLLEEEPEYVLHALDDISGPGSVPSVMRLKRGEPKPLNEAELRALIATLFAVADHCAGGPGRGESVAGKKVTAKLRLRVASEEETPAEAPRFAGVGRNEPCPCGSGKKFKRCHGDAPAASGPAPSVSHREDVHERDRRLVFRLTEYGASRFGARRMEEHFTQPFGARQVQSQLLGPLAGYDTPLDGRPLAAHFLAENAATLSEEDRRWLEAQLGSRLGLWEVLEVERGRGLELFELLTGRRCFVEERKGSTTLLPRALVLGRVVGVDGTFVLCGIHESALPPGQARLLVERVRREGGATMETSRLLAAWDEAVGAQALLEATPSRMLNTDGEPVRFVEQKLGLRKGARDEVVSRLLALDGVRVSEDGAKATVLALTREGNAMHRSWKNTSLASVRITQRQAVLSTNSRERAERFTRLLQETLGELATLGERTEQAPPELRGRGDVHIDGQLLEGPPNPWQLGRSVLDEWLDTPVPALGGLTPRAAAKSEQAREDLHWLLKELEHRGSGVREGAEALDARPARRLLGLDDLGQPLPHHELELAVGAGRKISETILEYAQPLLDEGGAQDKAHLESTLQFAVTAWNAVIAHDRDPALLGEARRRLSGGAGSKILLERFDELVRRKRERFPHDQRSVAKVEVVKKGRGELGVLMIAAVTPELREKLERAGIKP